MNSLTESYNFFEQAKLKAKLKANTQPKIETDVTSLLCINGVNTQICFNTPIYNISKLKKFYKDVKKGDSIWYQYISKTTDLIIVD